jgi:trehalose synthase
VAHSESARATEDDGWRRFAAAERGGTCGGEQVVLQPVSLGHKSLADYTHLAGRPLIQEIRELAENLKGLRVLHLSATAFGGGVAEILYTLVPLMNDVGIEAEWQVMLGREEFYNATKRLHNALQGSPDPLTEEEWRIYERYNALNATEIAGEWDVIIVHDPQPAAIKRHVSNKGKTWVWRCHIDLSTPNQEVIERMVPFIREYDASVWHVEQYVPQELKGNAALANPGLDGVHIVPPAIDPLSPKNMALSPEDAAFVCDQFGIDVDRPLMCQVSRFDPWKDPIGVIDAYRSVTEEMPEVQLALVGSMATDDPEGWEFFNSTMAYADGDPDIHILNNLNNVGAIEVNAFQSQADVVIQKSRREGFGLTVSEALWKARPFIGGHVGGIPLQVQDGETGFLVSSPEECAERSLRILREPDLGKRLGRSGKEHVRKHFLTPRLLRDWLGIFKDHR